MKERLASKDDIAIHPTGRFKAIAGKLSAEKLAELPEHIQDVPLGEVYQQLEKQFERGGRPSAARSA